MKERDERPAKRQGPGQGLGFLNICDPDEMRIVLLWEAHARHGWDTTFRPKRAGGPWKDGGLNFRTHGPHSHLVKVSNYRRAGYFHPEVAERILDGEYRRSLTLKKYTEFTDPKGAAVLKIGAIEVLKVSQDQDACSVILAVHAIVPGADYRRYCETMIGVKARSRFGEFLTFLLRDPEICADHPVALARDRGGRSRPIAPALLTVIWVPQQQALQWEPKTTDTATELSTRLGVPVSVDIMGRLQQGAQGRGHSAGRITRPIAAASGWQWSEFPSPTGKELDEEEYASALHRTHLLSQSWAITVGEHGVAYIPRQNDGFLCEGMLRAFSADLDVHLLIALGRLRVRALSEKIAATAKKLKAQTRIKGISKPALDDLDKIIDDSLELDSDAVTFLASEWWTDLSGQHRPDHIGAWMREACGLDEAVAQVVEQARLLRESIQTLIEREEHRVDLERQDIERQRQAIEREQQESSRMMEWALGVLAFIGIPLSVLLEIWINWDPGTGLWGRHWLWWLSLNGVIVGAVGIGLGLAKFFHVRIGRPPRGLSPAKEPEMPSRAEPRRIPPPPQATPHEDDSQEPPTQKKE